MERSRSDALLSPAVAAVVRPVKESEIAFVDQVLDAWSSWAMRAGIDLRASSVAHHLGPKPILEGRFHLPLSDDAMVFVDQAVARLPTRLKDTIDMEYFTGAPGEVKARWMGITRTAYRQRLYGAQWVMYAALLPDVEGWMKGFSAR